MLPGSVFYNLRMQATGAVVDEQLAKNRIHLDAMLAAISSREAIGFIGAGLSVPLKYLSWPALLDILRDRANRIATFTPSDSARSNVLQYAEEIRTHFKKNNALEEFHGILGREYGLRPNSNNCSPTHCRLVKLPLRTLVTTNYDGCLEAALDAKAFEEKRLPPPDPSIVIKKNRRDPHRVSLFLRSIVEDNDSPHIAHLHGKHDETDTIVLTTTDYLEAYGITPDGKQPLNAGVTLHRLLVWSLFATRRIVFFGCSMEDPYIVALLNMVAIDLAEREMVTHFVILPIDEQSAPFADGISEKFLRFGLQPVFFDNCSGDFSKLDQLLDEAIEFCLRQPSSVKNSTDLSHQPQIQVSESTSSGKLFVKKMIRFMFGLVTARLFRKLNTEPQVQIAVNKEKPVNSDWLEEVNQSTTKGLKKNEN